MTKPVAEHYEGLPRDIAEAMSELYFETDKFAGFVIPSKSFESVDDSDEFPPVPSYMQGQLIAYNSGSLRDSNPPVRRKAVQMPSEEIDTAPTATAEHMIASYRFVGTLQELYKNAVGITDIKNPSGDGAEISGNIDKYVKRVQKEEGLRTFGAFLLAQGRESGERYAGMQISRRLRDELPLEIRQQFMDELQAEPEHSPTKDLLRVGNLSRMIGYVVVAPYFPTYPEAQKILRNQAETADNAMGFSRNTRKQARKKHRKLAEKNFQGVMSMHRWSERLNDS